MFFCLELQRDKVDRTYGGGEKTLEQTLRFVSDSLLAYRLKIPPIKNRKPSFMTSEVVQPTPFFCVP